MNTEKRKRGRPQRPPSTATGLRLPDDLREALIAAAASESLRLGYNISVNGLVVKASREIVKRCQADDIGTVMSIDMGGRR
jgi:hypothetical protein